MNKESEIVYQNSKPYGIRNSDGFLFFFAIITNYPNQEKRYRQEIKEQHDLANYLLEALKNRRDLT